MKHSPQQIVFFIDRCLGNKVIVETLRKTGITIEITDDHYYWLLLVITCLLLLELMALIRLLHNIELCVERQPNRETTANPHLTGNSNFAAV